MIPQDMPEVLDIEQKSFESPWPEQDFIDALMVRNRVGMVVEIDDRIVGFLLYEIYKKHLHLLKLAVHPEWRRQGVGTEIVEKLASKLSNKERTSLSLEVRESNLPAQLFFKQSGFKLTETLRDVYDDTMEDAYAMRFTHLPNARKIVRGIERLAQLTGVPWELAHRQGRGKYERWDLQKADEHRPSLVLRPGMVLQNPSLAADRLNQLWGTDAYLDRDGDNGLQELIVPVHTVSQVRWNRGKEGELRQAFESAGKPWQRKISEEKRDRGTAHDLGP